VSGKLLSHFFDECHIIHLPECNKSSQTKKSAVTLFTCQSVTGELERIDIKKYHLRGFGLKLLIKRVDVKLLPFLNTMYHQDDVKLVTDMDADFAFATKIGKDTLRDAYPAYVIAYLHLRALTVRAFSDVLL
jgi:hypothetical protein